MPTPEAWYNFRRLVAKVIGIFQFISKHLQDESPGKKIGIILVRVSLIGGFDHTEPAYDWFPNLYTWLAIGAHIKFPVSPTPSKSHNIVERHHEHFI